jgi:hypothetical protein
MPTAAYTAVSTGVALADPGAAIKDLLKQFKAMPLEEVSVATALDIDTTRQILGHLATAGLVEVRPSRKYPGEDIAVGTDKLFREG